MSLLLTKLVLDEKRTGWTSNRSPLHNMAQLLYPITIIISLSGILISLIQLVTAYSRLKLRHFCRKGLLSSKHYPSGQRSQKQMSGLLSLITFVLLWFQILSQISYIARLVLCIPLYFQSTIFNDCDDIRQYLSSFQLIFWHCSTSVLFCLLSYRLYTMVSQLFSCRIFTILGLLIASQITIFLSLSILHFDELTAGVILQYVLMIGYGIECVLSMIQWMLYVVPLCRLSVYQSEQLFFDQFSGSSTSVYGKTPGVPRRGHLFTVTSVQTMNGEERFRSGSDAISREISANLKSRELSYQVTQSAQSTEIDSLRTSFVTAPYQEPPLKLKSDADQHAGTATDALLLDKVKSYKLMESTRWDSQMMEREVDSQDVTIERMVGMVMKYALLTTMVVTWKVIVIGFLMGHWVSTLKTSGSLHNVIEDDMRFTGLELWYFAVNLDCINGGIAMYLCMNLEHSDRQYRKCCMVCDRCCEWLCEEVANCWVQKKYGLDELGHGAKKSCQPFDDDYRAM